MDWRFKPGFIGADKRQGMGGIHGRVQR